MWVEDVKSKNKLWLGSGYLHVTLRTILVSNCANVTERCGAEPPRDTENDISIQLCKCVQSDGER